jgi:hypothetical protein
MKRVFASILVLSFLLTVNAQVAINTDGSNPDANTMLDIRSTNRGVKFPRLTTTQRNAMPVSAADAGLMVFDVNKQALYMYNGAEWLPFAFASNTALSFFTKHSLPLNSWQAWRFGVAVSISGDYAAVSATEDTLTAGTFCGSVYIYKRTNGAWALQTRLLPPDAAHGDYFGTSVSFSGDDLMVGSPYKDNGAIQNQGAAYIFHRSGDNWSLQQKLLASDGITGATFGFNVIIKGDVAVVSAPTMKVGSNEKQGAVYIFTRSGTTWTQQPKITANDGIAGLDFGSSISLDGDYLAVGAVGAKLNGIMNGAAYIFVKGGNTWTQQTKILSTTPTPNGYFGCSVSLEGDLVVVGASDEVYAQIETGTAHIYRRSGALWNHQTLLYSNTPEYDNRFGTKVFIRSGYIFISAPGEVMADIKSGAVSIYRTEGAGVRPVRRFALPDPQNSDGFATAMDCDGMSYILSSRWHYRDPAKSSETGVICFGTLEQ